MSKNCVVHLLFAMVELKRLTVNDGAVYTISTVVDTKRTGSPPSPSNQPFIIYSTVERARHLGARGRSSHFQTTAEETLLIY